VGATVTWVEGNGSPISYTTRSTAGRFCCTDSASPALTYPIPIPSGGIGNYARSYWKHFFLDLASTFTRINNVQFYCDGTIGWTFGTGGGIFVALRDASPHGCPVASYAQSTGNATSGNDIHDAGTGHAYYKGQTAVPVDVETYTSGSKLVVDDTNHDVAEKTYGVVLQLKVDGDATLGAQAAETLTATYDEI
jgi:hypothetical protein